MNVVDVAHAFRVSDYEQSLLQFDLSSVPSSAIVQSATLDLYVYGVTTDTPVNFHSVTAPWSEDTVTWATEALGEPRATARHEGSPRHASSIAALSGRAQMVHRRDMEGALAAW